MKRQAKISILLCTVCLIAASFAPAANASITGHNWIGALVNDSYDSFYGTSITGYEEGTTATLVVNVQNNYGDPINLSAVKVSFDWGQNYTSTETNLTDPYVLQNGASHLFTITFTTPNTTVATNYVTHSYIIYAEHVNSTHAPQQLVAYWHEHDTGFAVLSTDQANAKMALEQLDAYPSMSIPFLTAEARQLQTESSVAESQADTQYNAGNFADASTNYQKALTLLQNAYSNETSKWGSMENTFQGLLSGAQSMLFNQGYAWLLFGIALLLMGIGVIVYLVRKSGTPKTT